MITFNKSAKGNPVQPALEEALLGDDFNNLTPDQLRAKLAVMIQVNLSLADTIQKLNEKVDEMDQVLADYAIKFDSLPDIPQMKDLSADVTYLNTRIAIVESDLKYNYHELSGRVAKVEMTYAKAASMHDALDKHMIEAAALQQPNQVFINLKEHDIQHLQGVTYGSNV